MTVLDIGVVRGALTLLAFFFLSWIGYRVSRPVFRWIAPTASGLLSNILRYGIVFGGLVFALREANASEAQIWTVVAIFSAALALALESTAKDFLNGVKLLVFGIYRNDDLVTIGNYTGHVIEVTDSFTRLRERWTNSIVYIRNSDVIESVVVNHSREPLETLRLDIPVKSSRGKILQSIKMIELSVRSHSRFETSEIQVHYLIQDGIETFIVFVPNVEKKTREVTMSVLYTTISIELTKIDIEVGRPFDGS